MKSSTIIEHQQPSEQLVDVIELSKQLINRKSITPDDANCQQLIIDILKPLEFNIQQLPFGNVKNLWAVHGENKPIFCFLGHTDVVPPGPTEEWQSNPFEAAIRDERLYGRGAADMKTGIAAMLCAVQQFLKDNPNPPFSIAFMITSDEEGIAIDGTRKVIDHLQQQGINIDWCLVGEPSSSKTAGDIVKFGRRGSLHGLLKIFGKQGHIAYIDQKDNPIHRSFKALQELTEQNWDFKPNPHFPSTSMQISNLHAGLGADNVIPGEIDVRFNFRFSTATSADHIQQVVEAVLDKHQFKYQLDWRLAGKPFLTPNGKLLDAIQAAITKVTGHPPQLSTAGGTSDGRFIAPTGTEVIEVGVCNPSIHQVDESVSLDDLDKIEKIYLGVLQELGKKN